jgi:pSer/pThr/pTyr-binding forkhead associated (FHA) protein
MMPQQSAAVPHLVVLAPDAISGRRIELSKDYLVVGREPTCDVRLDDPHVSRTHAALRRRGSTVYVEDLGSSGGTFVNGNPVTMTELVTGDVVAFATVQARFDAVVSPTDETRAMPTLIRPVPAGPVQQGAAPAGEARYYIGRQDADVISNVGRDQYNAHVQQVVQRRDSFLREIAATKTRGRWLAWTGFLVSVAGLTTFGYGFYKQYKTESNLNLSSMPSFSQLTAGFPIAMIGVGLAAIGSLLLTVGIILHIVAASRRRRVELEMPLPMPWPPYGEPPPSYREPRRTR